VECLCNIENYSVQTDMMTDKPKRIGAAVKWSQLYRTWLLD
jgi:hypothetical protein